MRGAPGSGLQNAAAPFVHARRANVGATHPRAATMLRHTFFALLLCLSPIAAAQDFEGFDPAVLMQGAQDVLARTPDREVDGLFQSLHGAMRRPAEAQAICGLFDDDADRSLDGLNAVAMRLGPDSRQRFADAIGNALVAGLQGQPQRYDEAAAAQALRANGARAAILHDGFTAGLADGATRDARCGSLGQMLGVLAQRPQAERASVLRLLLSQGLAQAWR